jgi:hypothetical protein
MFVISERFFHMAPNALFNSKVGAPLLAMLGVLSCGAPAWAQERADVEQLQATTQALIDVLVESGVLTPEKASKLVAAAKAKVQAAQAQSAAQAALPEVGKDGKKVVRIPYVPESVKKEMRDQIKQEVLAQAHTERWGETAAYPEWLNRFKLEGDFRLREELVRLPSSNTPAGAGFVKGNYTRAADIAQTTSANGLPSNNTNSDFDRTRVRARLGVTAAVSDTASAGVRLSTGSTTERTSTNQTLGQNFNKYAVVFDHAYLTLRPWGEDYTLRGGRMPNPFFGTDLVWADDLGFEGVTATAKRKVLGNSVGQLTAGYFPITPEGLTSTRSRSLLGLQAALDMKLNDSANQLKLGAALYNYQGLQGHQEVVAAQTGEPTYATRYAYVDGLRQRGNTLLNVRADGDTGAAVYGLATGFRELNLTAAMDVPNLLPVPLRVTGDFVKNLGFRRSDNTAAALADAKDYGYLLRVQVGQNDVVKRGDWNASLAYRYLGSDAVLDAFTNSDFGLGGTNNKGFVLGGSYGLAKNTAVAARWMSSKPISSYAPGGSATKLSVDTLQVDLNTRF